MTLTDAFVRKLKHNGSSVGEKYSDGGGMYLHVTATGKYWRLAYRFGGKQKLLAMGVYPEVSLAKARKRREQAREQLADGIDPAEARREKERAHVAETVDTFSAVAMEWHAMRAKRVRLPRPRAGAWPTSKPMCSPRSAVAPSQTSSLPRCWRC